MKILKIKELYLRFWQAVLGYKWHYPFCVKLTCPFNRNMKCIIEEKIPLYVVLSCSEAYCPLEARKEVNVRTRKIERSN